MTAPPEGFRAALEAAFRKVGRPPPVLLELETVPGGSINQTFRLRLLSGVYFCKWNPDAPPGLFQREKEGLAALAGGGSSLVIPQTVAVTPENGATPPLLVLEYLEPDEDGPSRATWEGFGRGLAELHRGRGERFGFGRNNYCGLTVQENDWSADWAGFFAQRRIGALAERLARRNDLGASEIRDLMKLADRLPVLLSHRPEPSLIHGDLWSGNFLAAQAGPCLVDPAAYYADREAEWGMMSLFGGFPDAVLSAYMEVLPMPGGWRERQPLYQLYHLLNHFLLFGGGYGGQALRLVRKFI